MPRQSASFLRHLGLHCVVKMISRDPACHSSNSKSNKHCKRLFSPFILGCRLNDSEQSCGTDSGCIQTYCMIQMTHLWQSMTGYCLFFFSFSMSILLLLFCFGFFFLSWFVLFAMPEFFLELDNMGGKVHKDGAALQHTMLKRRLSGITWQKRGWQWVVFFFWREQLNMRQHLIRTRAKFIETNTKKGIVSQVRGPYVPPPEDS